MTDEKNGETVIGAVVMVKGSTTGATTDIDGNFVLEVAPGTYTIEVKYVGYQAKEVADIVVEDKKEAKVNVIIGQAKATQLADVVVKTSMKKENISAMITYQKNTNTVAQVVSAEAIRRSPDRNTGEVLKRVSSASIQDGKYLVVRGLADRYNQATLNGALLSSTEPDRKSFSFDLFPSGMIENIVVNKAATPDLPGEFAGGLIQVNTKDVPSKNFMSFQVGSGANMQTVGQDFAHYNGGKLDWLGIDDGTRALPSSVPDKDNFRKLTKAQRIEISKGLENNWGYEMRSGAPNANFQAAAGMNKKVLGGKTLGAIAAVSYNKQNRRTEVTRTFYNQGTDPVEKTLDFNEESYNEEVLWGALGNVTLEMNKNNKISLKGLYNITSQNNTLIRNGRNNDYGGDVMAFQQAFKSTSFVNGQLAGNHFLEKAKTKINWNTSYVNLAQNQPNLRRMEYRRSDGDSSFLAVVPSGLPSLASASMLYSRLTDNIVNASVDAFKPFTLFGRNHTIKAGYMGQTKSRTFNSRPFGMVGGTNALLTLPANELFAVQNMSDTGFQLNELSDKDYDYSASSLLNAGFVMLDNSFGEQYRLVWGVRYENFNQVLNGFRSNKPVSVDRNVGDFLPSLNFTYKPTEKANIRACASQTVIRPEFRELSPFAFYDFELLAAVQGNSDLQRTKISNFDLRYELYPRSGEMFTVGAFYKYFVNPIEQFYNESGVNTFSFTYNNAPSARSYGAEIEFRKRLDFIAPGVAERFTAFANASYIFNNVNFEVTTGTGDKLKVDRPMQGQSPYVINSGLQYDGERSGTSITLLFNMIGRRIFLVGNQENPNIWEAPRPLFDMQISQKLLKDKAGVKLSVTDLLNKKANFYQDINGNGTYDVTGDFLRISRLTGTTVSVSFMYNL
ncbi:TonB-dependent receptor [Nemorincola caseinilytica]|uniref:TonB-dependent receptor n=1 Tax=Nemorincola caseinilytica TaxID=2054315 RepID=UPI0031E8809F